MGIIRNIINDYERLIKTKITIPLDNGEIIKFVFQPQSLPHLIGLQYLVDNPILFEYSQNRLSATDLYKGMREGTIDCAAFEKSKYFGEIYRNRIKYFSSSMILEIIQARQIVKFNPKKIKNFSTKLNQVEYIFWKWIKDEDNNYGYFGIGFMATGKKSDMNYPNTFFFRMDNQYIFNQKKVIPLSFWMKDKTKKITFDIYWDEIRRSMVKNPHYKYLTSKGYVPFDELKKLEFDKLIACDEEARRHYELLCIDELNKAYLPYMDDSFRWTNDEKLYVLKKMNEEKKIFYPNEMKILINEYKQKYNFS